MAVRLLSLLLVLATALGALSSCGPLPSTGNGEPYSGLHDNNKLDPDDPNPSPNKTYEVLAKSTDFKVLVAHHDNGLHEMSVLRKRAGAEGFEVLGTENAVKKLVGGKRVYASTQFSVAVDASSADLKVSEATNSLKAFKFDCSGREAMSPFAGGAGTQENPYKICSSAQLNNIRGSYLGAYYVLWANLDLASHASGLGWNPIGNMAQPFFGNFDGNLFEIHNLKIAHVTGGEPRGLFGVVTNGGVLSNMRLYNVDVAGHVESGALVGRTAHSQIINVHSTGRVSSRTINAGGVIGLVKNVSDATCQYTIWRSSSAADVTAWVNRAGGLIGSVDNTTCSGHISDSHSTGSVRAIHPTTTTSSFAGGLAGGLYYTTILRSYSTSEVVTNNSAGGLFGFTHGGTIQDCFHAGSVTAVGGHAGGLIGTAFNQTIIRNSYANSNVLATWAAGGLVGQAYYNPALVDSFFAGTLSRAGGIDEDRVGGLVGAKEDGNDNEVSITNSLWARLNAAPGTSSCIGNRGAEYCSPMGNDEVSALSYFFDSSNQPMSNWNFSTIWKSDQVSLPKLRPVD
jgi:hypothetical protein